MLLNGGRVRGCALRVVEVEVGEEVELDSNDSLGQWNEAYTKKLSSVVATATASM